jgi:uncharacterized membrane protein (UPF0127 family)
MRRSDAIWVAVAMSGICLGCASRATSSAPPTASPTSAQAAVTPPAPTATLVQPTVGPNPTPTRQQPLATATSVALPGSTASPTDQPPAPTADAAGTPFVVWSTVDLTVSRPSRPPLTLRVQIADTPSKQSIGLSGRQSLGDIDGMLFVFAQPGRYDFWMRNTAIPLSIAFADATGKIIAIQDMAPETDTRHSPNGDYLYALEVAQGDFSQRDIRVGDRLVVPSSNTKSFSQFQV